MVSPKVPFRHNQLSDAAGGRQRAKTEDIDVCFDGIKEILVPNDSGWGGVVFTLINKT